MNQIDIPLIAKTITDLQITYRTKLFRKNISLEDSFNIISLFEKVYQEYGIFYFCELKHKINQEENNYLDLMDLFEDLADSQKSRFLNLLNRVKIENLQLCKNPDFDYSTLVLSDLDNTCFENTVFGLPTKGLKNGDMIPGMASLIKRYSHNNKTTTTFISARPRQMENHSIDKIKEKLYAKGITRFCFTSGELYAPLFYTFGLYTRNLTIQKRACIEFAYLKFQCYNKIRRVFPEVRFVFCGDDTQGDVIYALALLLESSRNICYIRNAAPPGDEVIPLNVKKWPNMYKRDFKPTKDINFWNIVKTYNIETIKKFYLKVLNIEKRLIYF